MKRTETLALAVAVFLFAVSGVLWLTKPDSPGVPAAHDGGDHTGGGLCGHDHSAEAPADANVPACGHDHSAEAPAEDGAPSCDHDHSGEHAHGEGAADLEMSIDEIMTTECEHGVATHLCDDCRYEVGVVKVDESLIRNHPTSEEGLIRVIPASRSATPSVLRVTGEVGLNENQAVRISPQVPGIIRSVPIDIGARVKRGDVLFEIESRELGRAFSEYERNRAMADLARQNFEREKTLFDKKISSEWDMIETQMVYKEHETNLQASETALRVLGFTDEDLRSPAGPTGAARTGRLPVRSPIDGRVIEKQAVVGERVDEGDDLMMVADLGAVWVWADIYEQDLATLIEARRHGPVPVEVSVHAFPGLAFPGEIDYVGAVMQERTRTVKVRATVANGEELLRPGMFCEIRLLLGITDAALAVPKAALLSDEGVDFIFKHLTGNCFVRRPVDLGREFEGRVEVLAGLGAGEMIVTDGAFLLKSDVLRSKMGAG